jgi:hypothetical protein
MRLYCIADRYVDISMNNWIRRLPPELVTSHVTLHSNPGICSVRVFCGIQIPELVEMFVLKSRTETDARKKVSVIFVLISRTNFSSSSGFYVQQSGI